MMFESADWLFSLIDNRASNLALSKKSLFFLTLASQQGWADFRLAGWAAPF